MARAITLESYEWIEIKDATGNVTGGFQWNPADLDIVKRCEEVISRFESLEDPGNDDEAIYKVSDEIKKQFDYLLNTDASALFPVNPLSPRADGELYAEYVLGVLTKFIEDEMDVRIKRTNARIKKYTGKYAK